jgi:hypothetical protein
MGMGGTCSTYGSERNSTMLRLEKLKVRDHSEDVGIDRRIILEWILYK